MDTDDKNNVIAIRKKSTGEIFHKGDTIYLIRYDHWTDGIYFDDTLDGVILGKTFYKNCIRGNDGSIYGLDEISLTKEPVEPIIIL